MSDSFSKVVDLFTETKGDVKYDGNKENLLATIMKNKQKADEPELSKSTQENLHKVVNTKENQDIFALLKSGKSQEEILSELAKAGVKVHSGNTEKLADNLNLAEKLQNQLSSKQELKQSTKLKP